MIQVVEFRGLATAESNMTRANLIRNLLVFLPAKKLPPIRLLNQYLALGEIDHGMSGGIRWAAFSLSKDDYTDICQELGMEPGTAPDYVRTELQWQAWCYQTEYGIPYDEYIGAAEKPEALITALIEAEKNNDDELADEIHLQYLDASKPLDALIDRYLKKE